MPAKYFVAIVAIVLAVVVFALGTATFEFGTPDQSIWKALPKQRKAELERRKADIEKRRQAPSPEGLERKARSIARLKAEGVPIFDALPVIETVAEVRLRRADEVARRALALVVVAVKGAGEEEAVFKQIAAELGVSGDLTAKETAFIGNPAASKFEHVQFAWRYEALHVLLWSIGFVDTLDRPEKTIDVESTIRIFWDNKREGLIAKAKLRPGGEILDAADLIYRYHWAVKESRFKREPPPAGLNASIVLERHYALNWLIGYAGQEWDDVNTDT